jgi:antitoxin Phd
MPPWQVQDAKARFSEMLDICLNEGPQVISRRGVDAAVLVPIDQWRRLRGDAPTLKDLLLSDHARADIPVPPRGGQRRRGGVVFE